MHHIAIMKPSWKLIPKILSGEKTIESRWYQTKRAPWDTIKAGDTVFFKNSGKPVTAHATVSKVLQFTISDITEAEAIIRKYNKHIHIPEGISVHPLVKYCILIFLEKPKAIKPFNINKEGFGAPAAWMTVKDVKKIKVL